MSVRKRKWRDKHDRQHETWMVHVHHTWPDGRKQSIRKVSPVQTKRGAEQYEREIRAQLLSGNWKGGHKKQTPTLEDFAEEFLACQATLNKPTELQNKKHILKNHLIPTFGKRRLDDIDERSIDAYTVKKLENGGVYGKPLSAKTVNNHLKVLGRMLRIARKWKLIREIPDVALLKKRKPDFDFLDFEEAEAFIDAAAQHEPDWHPFVVTAIRTGLRIGELVALRWREDVDLDRRRIRVQQSYHPVNGFTTTKNDRIREIPLTWDATEALRTQWSRVDGEFVFPGAGGGVLDGSVSNDMLARISAVLEMRSGITNHTMRHSFASQAVMRGIPIRQVQEWLGHHSVVVTMRYAHLARGVGDELIQRLSPDPGPEDGPKSRSGAARSRHTDSTRNRPKSKSASYTGKKGRS